MGEPLGQLIHRKAVEYGLLGTGGAGKARVLMYHGIGEAGCHRVNVRHVAAQVFDGHLRTFKEHFHVVPLSAVFAGERHPAKLTVAITFDDGLRNCLTHALPVLREHQVPASFFITGAAPLKLPILWGDLLDLAERRTDRELNVGGLPWRKNPGGRYAWNGNGTLLRDHIKQAGGWEPKQEIYEQLGDMIDGALLPDELFWRLLNNDELRALAADPLVTIGGHGWWHNDMGRIPLAEVKEELNLSKNYLEDLLQRPVQQLAWPDGSYSSESMDAAEGMGFTQQLAVNYVNAEDRTDPRILDRYGIFDFPVHERWLRSLIAAGAHR